MAVLGSSSSNKENIPPPHGIVAVKSHRMKRPRGVKARRRAPLRDITNLFLAPWPPSAVGNSAAVPARSLVAAKVKYSLRKEFR